MERRDALIGLVGALVVLGATVGVGLAGSPVRTTFEIAYPVGNVHVGDGNAAHFNTQGYTDTFDLSVPGNATMLFVNASVAYLGAPQAAALAALVAPDGTRIETEMTAAGTPTGPRLVASFAVPIQDAPAPARVEVEGPSPDLGPTPAPVVWTLEVAFSSGLAPAPSATTAWEAGALAWRGEATPLAPTAR